MEDYEDESEKGEDKERNIVKEAKERFKQAMEFYSEAREQAIDDTKFAMGDSDNGWQWPDEAKKGREAVEKVCLTVNQTAQHCNQIINNIRVNRPSVKVSGVDNLSDAKTAEILGGLIRNIQVASNSDDAHDTAAEHAIYGGEGYWRVITEYESDMTDNQVITIKSLPNPNLVFVDPNAKEEDRSDAKWGFIFEDVPIDDIKAEYPDIDPQSWGDGAKEDKWSSEKTIRRAEYFYCEYEDDILYKLADGTFVLDSEYGEPEQFESKRKLNKKKWKWCKLVGGHDEPIDEREWLGDYLPIITVVGKEVNVDGEIVRKGVVRDLKDPARMVNYAYSETVQNLALQNNTPYLYSAEAIEGHEDIWKSANLDNQTGLPFNAYDADGNILPVPQRQQPPTMATAQIQLLQLSSEQMKAASGQSNANFGIKSEAASGVGIQRLKVQGETATFHFPDNLARALRYEAKVLIDLIQKYYDSERVVRILGLDGKDDKAYLNPAQQQPYMEAKQENGDVKKIFNPMVGRYDVTVDTGPSYQTQRQEAAANLNDLAARNPALMGIAGDLIMRAQDFPMADKLAERLAKTIPPELQDNEDGNPEQYKAMVMQAQERMKAMDDAIAKLMEENDKLKLEKQSKEQELALEEDLAERSNKVKLISDDRKYDIDEYRAETDRMDKLNKGMTDDRVREIVLGVVSAMNQEKEGPEVMVNVGLE